MSDTNDYSAARPSVCPVCNTEQEFDESLGHDSRENGDLEFLWECENCEFQFTTIKQLDNSGPEVHTLLWQENEEGEVVRAIQVPEGEDHFSVKAHRADLNMRTLPNYEVHGRKWAINRLYEVFCDLYSLEDQPEEEQSIAWLPEEMQTEDNSE